MDNQPKERRKHKLPVAVEDTELLKIMKVANHKHHKLAYLLAWYSSLRISEVMNVEPRDINWQDKTILVRQGKGSKDRIVPLPEVFIEPMLELLPLKKLIGVRALQKAFKDDCKKAGILEYKPSIHFHSLRHGFATHGIEQGMDITELQMLMGHSNIATTSVYIHMKPKKALDSYRSRF